jgi:Fe-S-cluster containining protein
VSESRPDPCASCSIHQACCSELSGLRVTAEEFERCFAAHADELIVEHEGPVRVLSPKGGGPCPNLGRDGRCTVYGHRPIECRLFPYTLYVRRAGDGHASLGYHGRTRCPQKAALLPSDAEARAMVTRFGRQAFGERVGLEVSREGLIERLRRRASSALSKLDS